MVLYTNRKYSLWPRPHPSQTDRQTTKNLNVLTSSCARSARFATCARSSLRSPCRHTLKVQLIVILCCGVVYDCSHTADMHDVVMKGVPCYKDASEHDRVLQWEQWCPCPTWRAARFDQLDDSIQVWRPVVESA